MCGWDRAAYPQRLMATNKNNVRPHLKGKNFDKDHRHGRPQPWRVDAPSRAIQAFSRQACAPLPPRLEPYPGFYTHVLAKKLEPRTALGHCHKYLIKSPSTARVWTRSGMNPRLCDESFVLDASLRDNAGPFVSSVGSGTVDIRLNVLIKDQQHLHYVSGESLFQALENVSWYVQHTSDGAVLSIVMNEYSMVVVGGLPRAALPASNRYLP